MAVSLEGGTVLEVDVLTPTSLRALVYTPELPGQYDLVLVASDGATSAMLADALRVSEGYCAGVQCGACESDADCLEGEPCTQDACSGAGVCEHDALADCCAPYASCHPCVVGGDLDLSLGIGVSDVQCAILTGLWTASGKPGPAPMCLATTHQAADLNCDDALTVADVQLMIQGVLGTPLDPLLDEDGDGCLDTCAL